ncbi:DNA-3-methyladenine glycosylase, partial [Xanthomonas vasicola pv. musacearum NCPPB 4384]
MDLFDAPIAPLQVLNDMEGGVRYWPQLLPAALAQDAFEALRDGADWRSQRREMYNRVVDVPRLLASYRLDGALPAGL